MATGCGAASGFAGRACCSMRGAALAGASGVAERGSVLPWFGSEPRKRSPLSGWANGEDGFGMLPGVL